MDAGQGYRSEVDQRTTTSSSTSSPSHPRSFPSSPSSIKQTSAPSSSASSSSSSTPFSPSSSPARASSSHIALSSPHPVPESSIATSSNPQNHSFNAPAVAATGPSPDIDNLSSVSLCPNPLLSSEEFIPTSYGGDLDTASSVQVDSSNVGYSNEGVLSVDFTSDLDREGECSVFEGESLVVAELYRNEEMLNSHEETKTTGTSSFQAGHRATADENLSMEARTNCQVDGGLKENEEIRKSENEPTTYRKGSKEEMDRCLTISTNVNRYREDVNGDHEQGMVCRNRIADCSNSETFVDSSSGHPAAGDSSPAGPVGTGIYRSLNSRGAVEISIIQGELGQLPLQLTKADQGGELSFGNKFASDGHFTHGNTLVRIPPLEATTSEPALINVSLPSNDLPVEEIKDSSPEVSHESETSQQAATSTIRAGLQRAQTLPTGSLDCVDGGRNANVRQGLGRSRTEKQKGWKNHINENVPAAAASKLSNRKKKKIMKRLATVKRDGTVEFDIAGSTRFAPDLFGPHMNEPYMNEWLAEDADEVDEGEKKTVPPLQIAMLIVGTRGDVQPFVAIGKHLQEYGHRVRLATHSNFKDFVLRAGLEFYALGGDPKVLAEYMVKNKGFLPSGPSEIKTQRKQLKAIINSLLPACMEPDDTGVAFKAQAVIANPPAYGHVHVADYLKVPLHIFFTMPWTPTSEFPHPLSRVRQSAAYRLSYQVVDSLIWFGIRGLINDFRKKRLKLRPITYLSGSQGSIYNLPTGYIWSPHLVPKPKDWGPLIDVVGFCFLNLAQDYKPPDSLVSWLQAGERPIYVGFGSLPVEDPKGMTDIIVEALKRTSQRGIINKGWGGIGNLSHPPDFVYLLDNCPHDWLFPQCAAVVHHGGAGTTAAGLKAACPTTIVPFFGDQPFWGERVHAMEVGPNPIPIEHFSLDKLVHAIKFMLQPEVKQRAVDLAKAMEGEDGVSGAVRAFHKHLPKDIPRSGLSSSSEREPPYLRIFRKMACYGCQDRTYQ